MRFRETRRGLGSAVLAPHDSRRERHARVLGATNAHRLRLECYGLRPMGFVPDRAGFLDLARRGRLAFVYREVLADTDTPVSAYAKLGRGPYSFLLESVVGGEKWAAYSFAGVRPRAVIRARGSSVEILHPTDDGGFRLGERVTAA